MRPISGSTKAINDLTPGEWYYADMEFIALPTEIVCEWLGLEPWTQNGLTIIGYFYLHQYWIQVSDEEIAWIEAVEKALAENRPIE